MSMKELSNVLQELIILYRDTNDPRVMEELIMRGRPVIFYTLYSLKKYRIHLRACEDVELYDTAILGIYKCCEGWKEIDNSMVMFRIYSYITNEITLWFPYQPTVHCVPSNVIDAEMTCLPDRSIERLEIREQLAVLIRDNTITSDELRMLADYDVYNMTLEDVAAKYGVSYTKARSKLIQIRNIIKTEWCARGWSEL